MKYTRLSFQNSPYDYVHLSLKEHTDYYLELSQMSLALFSDKILQSYSSYSSYKATASITDQLDILLDYCLLDYLHIYYV